MRLKLFALAALAAAALIAIPAVVSQASKVKKHDVHVTIHGATVESLAGGKSVQAAHDKCKLYGDSAVIFKQKATTNPDGTVTRIGGVKQKTIGARQAHVDVFLVPVDGDNAREAKRYAHGLRIIPVESFQQALQALATLPHKA